MEFIFLINDIKEFLLMNITNGTIDILSIFDYLNHSHFDFCQIALEFFIIKKSHFIIQIKTVICFLMIYNDEIFRESSELFIASLYFVPSIWTFIKSKFLINVSLLFLFTHHRFWWKKLRRMLIIRIFIIWILITRLFFPSSKSFLFFFLF